MLGHSNKSVFGAAKEAEITHFFRKLNKNVKKLFFLVFFLLFLCNFLCKLFMYLCSWQIILQFNMTVIQNKIHSDSCAHYLSDPSHNAPLNKAT